MKKTIITSILIFSLIWTTFANYYTTSIDNFTSSVSLNEINSIENSELKYCEQVFLEAYMRREFTDLENSKCSDIFEIKIENQMNYMKFSFDERWIY